MQSYILDIPQEVTARPGTRCVIRTDSRSWLKRKEKKGGGGVYKSVSKALCVCVIAQ